MNCIEINKFEIKNILGSNINSENVQDLFKSLDVEPEVTKPNELYHYSFYSLGFLLIVTQSGLITSVYLFSEGSHNYTQYFGLIPYDIKLNNTQKVIERNLGKPDIQGVGDVRHSRNWCYWKSKGVSILFSRNDHIDNLCLF
jgi:hypothetical protein